MTINHLLLGRPTEAKYEVFSRADRLFPKVGRYYQGPLSDEEVQFLIKGVEGGKDSVKVSG